MADQTLRDVIEKRFGHSIDPQSDGGLILSSLTPQAPFGDNAVVGKATADHLSFAPTTSGVSVRAAEGTDAFRLDVPIGPLDFRIIPPQGTLPPQVEVKLLPLTLPLPFLFPAQKNADQMLDVLSSGSVELHLTDLLLVVTASENPPASAHLTLAQGADDTHTVTMNPQFACFDNDAVLGFGFTSTKVNFTSASQVKFETLDLFINPPGMPALALHATAQNLDIDLQSGGGFSGDIHLTTANITASPQCPRFLSNLSARVTLNHSAITLLEVGGTVKVSDELNLRVPGGSAPASDIGFTLRLALNKGWEASLKLKGDQDAFLWRVQPTGGVQASLVNLLGAFAVFTPLFNSQQQPLGDTGLFKLGDLSGAAGGVVGSEFIHTHAVTLYGGELLLKNSGAQQFGVLTLDLETELDVAINVGISISTKRPIKVRHKAIGLVLDFGANGGSPELSPVFDPTQGFTLDLSDPGLFQLPSPLDDILQTEGTRIAKENPLFFEVDLIPKTDLGVVTIDRAGIRVPLDLDPPRAPSVTALGAHVDAGLVRGGGYLRFLDDGGLAGRLDLSLLALGLRAGAKLKLTQAKEGTRSLTAVFAALEVEWPIPIPIGGTGLGLLGLLGAFAMHMERTQADKPTLEWFAGIPGGVDDEKVWTGKIDHWAFGAGAVIGTLEGGFIVHAKGMLMIELPGPRVLIIMQANILTKPPKTKGPERDPFLAVIDIGPDAISIGILIDYNDLKPLLQVRVPLDAFFNLNDGKDWRVDIGALPPKLPATVKFLSSFKADGYLLMHGNGIPAATDPNPPSQADFPIGPLFGFAIAVGVRAAFTWGVEAIGLFMRVTFQADIGISFKPLLLAGQARIAGELHIFIVSVSVSASTTIVISGDSFFIHADVCASVDLFFFDVSGCVTLQFGTMPPPRDPEPMLRALSLHARPPALLTGSGTDQPIDGSMGDAAAGAGQPLPIVPIDIIPVLQFEMCPGVEPACTFLGTPVQSLIPSLPAGAPFDPKQLPPQAWMRRGPRFYHYRLNSIRLEGIDEHQQPLPALVTGRDTPATWWDRAGRHLRGQDNDVQLALLNWNVNPTPAAAESSETQKRHVKNRWGDVCADIAPPGRVLWSFVNVGGGIAVDGWTLNGIAMPDKPKTVRSAPPDTILRVTEPWRSGDALADSLVEVEPASVLGIPNRRGNLLIAPRTATELEPRFDDEFLLELMPHQLPKLDGFANAVRLETSGFVMLNLLLRMSQALWESQTTKIRCFRSGSTTPDAPITLTANNSKIITDLKDLPSGWLDEPWKSTVETLWNAWHDLNEEFVDNQSFVRVTLSFSEPFSEIWIGTQDDQAERWRLLIVEGLTDAEVFRAAFDNTKRDEQIKRMEGALNNDPTQRALLKPNATYTVKVSYDVAVTNADAQDHPSHDPKDLFPFPNQEQSFQFKTDPNPPARLYPWVMATSPEPSQNFFFCGDDVVVVFSTPAVRTLFKGYDCKLFAVVKAASGKHPEADATHDGAKTDLDATKVPPQLINGFVFTPFSNALKQAVAGLNCLSITGGGELHERHKFRLKLEPLTDYILDLETDKSPNPREPLYRLPFSTSQYVSFETMAADVSGREVEHRWLSKTAELTALAQAGGREIRVSDRALEDALRAVEWGDLRKTKEPRVTVIWEDGIGAAPFQPFGVMVDTPEPVWRSRDVPEVFTDPSNDPQGSTRYRLKSIPWLDLIETSPGNLIMQFIHSTDGARTLLLLAPNARGQVLEVALRRIHHDLFEGNVQLPTARLLHADLHSAPWEGSS